jgi:oligopeptide transport system substrate-binding protein
MHRVPRVLPLAFTLPAVIVFAACQRTPPAEVRVEPTAQQRTLVRGLGAEPDTLDPQLAEDNAALTVLGDLYEGLTRESADGSIEPGSAESWQVTAEGRRYTFRLRRGLQWSNGEPLRAEHFAAGLQRATHPDTLAPYAELLEPIASVEVTDPAVLEILLKRPVPFLPAVLALPVAAPVHPSATEDSRPVNGPYRLVGREPGAFLELERNPHYRDSQAVRIARVRYLRIDDLTTELNRYRAGELDLTSEVPNSQIPWLREHLPDELKLAPFLSVYSYAINLERLPDVERRRALAMAIDRERLVRQVTGAGEQAAYGWIPDGIPGYEAARFPWKVESPETLAAKARKAWHGSGNAAPPAKLLLCTDASANHRRTAVALADMWRSALDVEVEILELEWSVYLATRRTPGDCDLLRLGWSGDFIDPEAFAMVFRSDHPQNTLGYSSAAYDALLDDSASQDDPAARMKSLARAEASLLEDVPVVPVFFRVSKRLVKPYVRGYADNPLGHLPTRQLSLAE